MNPTDFKNRFIASLPNVPQELDLGLDRFVVFSTDLLSTLPLASEDLELLTIQGLPCDAAPFLSFHAYQPDEIANRKETFGISEHYFPIGHNGSGDMIAIDLGTREVVYFNHDNYNERVLINSSLPQFAESLCIYQDHLTKKLMPLCLQVLDALDSPAARPGSMWHAEVLSELAEQA